MRTGSSPNLKPSAIINELSSILAGRTVFPDLIALAGESDFNLQRHYFLSTGKPAGNRRGI